MAGNVPRRYPCYFMITPSPVECPDGLTCQQTNRPMFYIKFGDGIWDQYRYTTHNPSFTPAQTFECANIPGRNGAKYYIANNAAVRPGRFLEAAVLEGRFDQAIPGSGEWYKIRTPQNVTGQQLANDLQVISDYMDNPAPDFGYQAAINARNNGQGLVGQQAQATQVMTVHAQAILQILQGVQYF